VMNRAMEIGFSVVENEINNGMVHIILKK